jgi:hypothetical protein
MNDEKNGITRLGRVLESRSHKVAAFHNQNHDFLGTIVSDGLKLDVYPAVIPHGSYLVCRSLCQPTDKWTVVASNSEPVKLPETLRPLQIGDRVLVVMTGSKESPEVVVVDIVEEG